jgi:hypothetical protein
LILIIYFQSMGEKMFFKKKVDRAFEWLRKQNPDYNADNVQNAVKKDNKTGPGYRSGKNGITLEKNDFLAMMLSALIVFGPIFIILILILILVF